MRPASRRVGDKKAARLPAARGASAILRHESAYALRILALNLDDHMLLRFFFEKYAAALRVIGEWMMHRHSLA